MQTTPLVNSDLVALVDDADYDYLSQFIWHPLAGYRGVFYAYRFVGGSSILMHRDILKPGPKEIIDHKDIDGLNNQRANLRICTRRENAQNARKYSDWLHSKYKGVTWSNQKRLWQANITVPGHRRSLIGFYRTQREAAIAYNGAAIEHYGEFARLNEIPPEPAPDDLPVPVPIFTSSYRGVYLFKPNGKWRACISHQKHVMHLGSFDDEEAAARAYDAAARRLHGDKARLNFPDS